MVTTSNLPAPPQEESIPMDAIHQGAGGGGRHPAHCRQRAHQTHVLALPPWSFALCKAQAACPQQGNPQEAGKSHTTQVHWLSCWRDDKDSLALVRQRNQGVSRDYIVTKPGKCISVHQMTLTKVGFYVKLKGKLTKKRCKCVTIFVNHYSR